MTSKYGRLSVITLACSAIVSCSETGPPQTTPQPTKVSDDHYESPAAPIGRLATAGKHCFRTPVDVAAAAGRVAAYFEQAIREYETARRLLDAGGPLPRAGSNIVGEVSDPDANNCITVSTYLYDDRPH